MRRELLVSCLLLLGACAPYGAAPDRPRIVWPVAPYQSRIEFIGVYANEKELLPPSELRRFLDVFLRRDTGFNFKRPFGIAVDSTGGVIVSDSLAANLRRFDFREKKVRWFAEGFPFRRPMGLCVDGNDEVYVADGERNEVLVFSSAGKLLRSIGKGRLTNPSRVVVNSRLGLLYVADGQRHVITVFSSKGDYLFEFGGVGTEPGLFAVPQGMAIDVTGRLFVADMLNARIQVFGPGGEFLYAFGTQGVEYWNFENPRDLCLTKDGLLHILDYRKGLLLGYTPAGEFVYALGSEGVRTAHPLAFSTPSALVEDAEGRLYIVDQLNKRLSVWQLLIEDYLKYKPLSVAGSMH